MQPHLRFSTNEIVSQTLDQGRRAWGGHGLPKVSPGPAMPYPSTPCGRATLKQPYGPFRGSSPTRRAACGRLPPLWTPNVVRLCPRRYLLSFLWAFDDVSLGFENGSF
jgi:hypothetical protein